MTEITQITDMVETIKLAETSVNEVNNRFIGNLDRFLDGNIEGWAIDTNNLGSPTFVDIFINDIKVTSLECSINRKDVLSAGFGSEIAGFKYCITNISQFFAGSINISVKFAGTDLSLSGSPIQNISLSVDNNLILSSKPTLEILNESYPINEELFVGVNSPKKISKATLVQDFLDHAKAGGITIIFPPLIDWNVPLFQRPQHMAKWLGRCGAKVLFSSCSWKYDNNVEGSYQLEENLYWTDQFPNLVNILPSSWICIYSTNPSFSVSQIKDWRDQGHKIIYEYIDHIDPKISGDWSVALTKLYNEVNQKNVDIFLASANQLREHLVNRFPVKDIMFIPNGVDTEFYFEKSEKDVLKVQENFLPVINSVKNGRKIVGYFGAIAPWLDYELIGEVASQNPDLDFVFIGPTYELKCQTPTAPNIFWIGQINYSMLPAHAIWFDVCFIPFEQGQIAQTTSPLKLYEYFALGKPVVVTSAMLECTQYEFVGRGSNAEEISLAISEALQKSSNQEFVQFLKEQAIQNSWESRSKDFLQAIREREDKLKYQHNNIKYVQISQIVKFIAFNAIYPKQKIVGLKVDFNLNKNEIKAIISNNDFYEGDLLSITLELPKLGLSSLISSSFEILANNTQLDSGYVLIDYLLAGKLLKILDYTELYIPDIVNIVHEPGENFEIRYRVLKGIPSTWEPSNGLWLSISNLSQVSMEDTNNYKKFVSSNPLGLKNPLCK